MTSEQRWKPEVDEDKMAFVSQYGKDVIGLLQPQPGERIIGLGAEREI
ncbi:hypothetical protein ACE6ED_02745 [Paenibacillus sp. CN-4]